MVPMNISLLSSDDSKNLDQQQSVNVHPSMLYPKEYTGPKPIREQIGLTASIYGLDPTSALQYAEHLPELASFVPADALEWTGWSTFPSIDALAKLYFSKVFDPIEKCCHAASLVLKKIEERHFPFYHWRTGQITPKHFRQSDRALSAHAELARVQRGDILVVAAQLGMLHRNRSMMKSQESFYANEFGLGIIIGGSICLTHPERITCAGLDMDLPGDMFDDPNASDRFDHASSLYFSHGHVEYDVVSRNDVSSSAGSASGFLSGGMILDR
jgi:hypothetical protein